MNIPTAIHYPLPLNLQPVFAKLGKAEHFLVAEHAAKTVLSLPMHPYLTEEEQDYICEHLLAAIHACQEQAVG